ncbi:MAG TPA: pilin [Bacillota bacterium]|nr:pilin [Bacillota bacterium]
MNIFRRTLLVGLTILSLLGGSLLAPVMVSADASTDAAKQQACIGSGGTWENNACTTTGPNLDSIIHSVVNVISILVGIAAVIMIMVGGFKYITSGGDSGSLASAKNTVIYAVIGLVIVALSQGIVRFVLDKTTNAPPKNNGQQQQN